MIHRARRGLPVGLVALLSHCSPPASAARPSVEGWSYDVTAGAGANELFVDATFPRGSEPELSVDDGAEPFVRDLALWQGATFRPVAPVGTSWFAPSCRSEGCRIRYRFLLRAAATSLDDPDVAIAHRGAWFAPPSTWLVRPVSGPLGRPYRFHVTTPPSVGFATGVYPATELGTYSAAIPDLSAAPYSAFGNLVQSRLDVGDGRTVELAMAPGQGCGRWLQQ